MNLGSGQSPEDALQLCSMNSERDWLFGCLWRCSQRHLPSVYGGHRAKYVFSGGLIKEVKWMLMHKNGVEEEQEEDYAIVWDWLSKAFCIRLLFLWPSRIKRYHNSCTMQSALQLILNIFMRQLSFQSMLHFHGVTWDCMWIIENFFIKLVGVYQGACIANICRYSQFESVQRTLVSWVII